MRRIFISGPHSAGKSTLGKALADKLGWEYKGEAARSVIEKMGNPKDMDFTQQLAFQEAVFKAQKKVQGGSYLIDDEETGGMIIDRSMLDVAAYLEWFWDKKEESGELVPGSMQKYANLRMRILDSFYLGSDDRLIILPVLPKVEDDGVRFTDGMDFIHESIMHDYWKMADEQTDIYKRTLIVDKPGTPEEYVSKVLDFLLYK